MKKRNSALVVFLTLFFLGILSSTEAQVTDSLSLRKISNSDTQINSNTSLKLKVPDNTFRIKPYIIPSVMVLYGITSLGNNSLKNVNKELRDEIYAESPHNKIHADNYLQFAPAVSVYLLNAAGVKGKHNLRDRTMLYVMSNIFLNGMVSPLKKITHQLRPDSSKYNAFPSGHTAEAFASAEFLRMEYKDVSPWYGVAGYAMAIATGYLRMYNNKHWFSDVVAGAGMGIISTKLAYWLYPKIQHKLFKDKPVHTMVMPYYQNGVGGISFVYSFKK